jgi:hypothetical protein
LEIGTGDRVVGKSEATVDERGTGDGASVAGETILDLDFSGSHGTQQRSPLDRDAALGEAITHRTNRFLNNHLEPDHRGSKQQTHLMRAHLMCGFKSFVLAGRFCWVYEEVRYFFRTRS